MFSRWLEIDTRKSALLIGPRRAGKTTYLKQMFPDLRYVTLDDIDALDWAEKDPKGFIQSLGNTAIIDEIQRVPRLTIAVKYAIDMQQARFFMTGSSSIGLLDATADSLAGRINLYSFAPPCWGENIQPLKTGLFTIQQTPLEIKNNYRMLQSALTYGLFPEILSQPTDNDKKHILQNYKNTYFTRDLMQLSNIENRDGIVAIYHHLIRSISSHLEVSNFARESGLSFPSTKKYLNALTLGGLTYTLMGYQYGPAKRHIKAQKHYFADNTILNSFNISTTPGQQIENFVISEFEKRRQLGHLSSDTLFYYKTVAGREIDLVFKHEDTLYAIEIKSTTKISRKDIRNLLHFCNHISEPCQGILFYMGEEYAEIEGIKIMPIAAIYGSTL